LAQCPNCKGDKVVKVKEWSMKPATKKGPALRVSLYKCEACGKKFRIAVKI
jgi:transposase-like protein